MDKQQTQHVRVATDSDNADVLRILRHILSAIPTAHVADFEPSDDYLQSIVKGCTVFLIEHDKQIVGLNALRLVDLAGRENVIYRKFAMIMAIGVEERKRRQGFGTALVEHMWQWLASEGVEMVQLNVATRNQTAKAFYERMGFETLSVQMGRVLSSSKEP